MARVYKEYGRSEHVSIQEWTEPFRAISAPAESKHDTLWGKLDPNFLREESAWHYENDKTSVHVTSAYSDRMDRICTISGQLHPQSLHQEVSVEPEYRLS
jgi:hypothetical protein